MTDAAGRAFDSHECGAEANGSAGRALVEPSSGSHPRIDSLVHLQRFRRQGALAFVALLLGACRSGPPAPAHETEAGTQAAAQPRPRLSPSARPNDATPSIPLNGPALADDTSRARQSGSATTPVYTPEQELARFATQPGYRVELVAAEPLVQDPVAIDFDPDGRMWVVEMRAYMPNLRGTGEDRPVGRIACVGRSRWHQDEASHAAKELGGRG